jgi:hypothetical protein
LHCDNVDLRVAINIHLVTDIRITVSKLRKYAEPPERELIPVDEPVWDQEKFFFVNRQELRAYLCYIEVVEIEDNLNRGF